MAAFDAAVTPQIRSDDLLGIVKSRKWWPEILVSMSPGPSRPSDLAAALKADAAVLSRGLSELRSLGLVEYAEIAEQSDARTRPHRLTLEGESIADRLDGATMVGKTRLEPVIRTAISFFTQLAIEDRVSLPRTEATVRRVVGTGPSSGYVSSVIEKVLREYDLQNRSWSQEVFLAQLTASATGKALAPSLRSVVDRLAEKKASTVYIRCARTQQPTWDRFIGVAKVLPSGSRTISPADIDAGDIPRPKGRGATLVYDNLSILQADLDAQSEMKSLVEAVDLKFCLGPRGTSTPGGVELIPVEA